MIARLGGREWAKWAEAARLAVTSDPQAFSSSRDDLDQLTDDEWKTYAGRYCTPSAAAFLDERDDVVVGMVGVEVVGGDALITNLWVQVPYRRRGVASALMCEAEGWAARRGAARLILTVAAGLDPALAFYRSLGYVPISDGIVLEKLISGDAGTA